MECSSTSTHWLALKPRVCINWTVWIIKMKVAPWSVCAVFLSFSSANQSRVQPTGPKVGCQYYDRGIVSGRVLCERVSSGDVYFIFHYWWIFELLSSNLTVLLSVIVLIGYKSLHRKSHIIFWSIKIKCGPYVKIFIFSSRSRCFRTSETAAAMQQFDITVKVLLHPQ